MCESAVYLVKGSEKNLVMAEAAKVLINGSSVTCIDMLGERKVVDGAELVEANLVKHEIILRKK
jgi:predicted RNA-binding protein